MSFGRVSFVDCRTGRRGSPALRRRARTVLSQTPAAARARRAHILNTGTGHSASILPPASGSCPRPLASRVF